MEDYREKLKMQKRIMEITVAVLVITSILAVLAQYGVLPFFAPLTGDSQWHSRWRGFITGSFSGLTGGQIVRLVRIRRALKDDKQLKKEYIQSHDERRIQIRNHAQSAAMETILCLGLAVIIISGYFSIAVSLTILACVLFSTLICLGFTVYYSKKF